MSDMDFTYKLQSKCRISIELPSRTMLVHLGHETLQARFNLDVTSSPYRVWHKVLVIVILGRRTWEGYRAR